MAITIHTLVAGKKVPAGSQITISDGRAVLRYLPLWRRILRR